MKLISAVFPASTVLTVAGHAIPAACSGGFVSHHFSYAWNHHSGGWNHYHYGWDHHHYGSQRSSQSDANSSPGTSSAPQSSQRYPHSAFTSLSSVYHTGQSVSVRGSQTAVSSTSVASSAPAPSASGGALNPNAANCQLALPSNALTAEGLSTPWELLPPCSQAMGGQQAFAEAAIIDSNGQISIYHPLIIDKGKTPLAAPAKINLDRGSNVALFFGFNGDVLQLVDVEGQDTNTSPALADMHCVNGLPGVEGDVFGQVSWCNTEPFWSAANAAVERGQLQIPSLGTNDLGKPCLSARSFEIIDQDQSDNLPTKYLLLPDGSTVQFTAANQARFADATEIDNASDESLIADFVDPAIGCTPFQVDSIDDPGAKVSSLATNELQALFTQQEPIALIPLNNPDTLLTASGAQSFAKTNAYRLGVNQPELGAGPHSDDGSPAAYCNHMISIQPPFLASFQDKFTNVETPDPGIGNNLFTFLCNRFLQSIPNLACTNQNIPVKCTLDGDGAATACTIGATTNASNSFIPTSAAASMSSHVISSFGLSQGSGVTSSNGSRQSSFVTSSHEFRQSSISPSSFRFSQSSGQGSITASSALPSQSHDVSSSTAPAFSSAFHGLGNYSAPAFVKKINEALQTATPDKVWFV